MMNRVREAGLTAIEMTVAITIMGAVLFYIFGSVEALTDTTKVAERKVTATAENFKGLEAMRDDLRVCFAVPGGSDGYVIGPESNWISYRLVDGEDSTPEGTLLPILSPRIYVFLEGGYLVRAVVDEAVDDPVNIAADSVREVKVVARHVAKVEFGDPLTHSGAFSVLLVTMVGNPDNDDHVQVTNSILVTSVNRFLAPVAATPPPPPSSPITYVPGSRDFDGDGPHLKFRMENVSADTVRFDGFRLDWSAGDVSYYQELRLDTWKAWEAKYDPLSGGGTGDVRRLTGGGTCVLPAGAAVNVWFKTFKSKQDGKGSSVSVEDIVPYRLVLLLGTDEVAELLIPEQDEGDD